MQCRCDEGGSGRLVQAARLAVAVMIVAAVPGVCGAANISVQTPNGGELLNAGSPFEITWTSSGVSLVRIQLSRDGRSTWANIATDIDAVGGTYTWDPVTGPASDNCFIRVRDMAGTTNDRSNGAFTVAPGLFDLLTPADTATGLSATLTLDWGDSDGCETYTLLVDEDPNFVTPEVNVNTLTSSTYTVGTGVLSPDVTYYWRVTADTAATATSGPTSTPASNNDFSFTTMPPPGAFDLVDPADAATGVSVTPTLDWGDSSDVATYTLQVDDDPLFAVPADYEVNDATLAVSTYTVGGGVLSGGTTYYWRVTAVNASGSTDASNNDFRFSTPPLPGAFALLSPSDGLTDVSPTPTLDWEDSLDAVTYTLQVDDDPLFTVPADYEVNETALTVSTYAVGGAGLSLNTVYHWRVMAVNGSGTTAASNNDFSFTTISALPSPGAFSLLSPADGLTDVSLTPTLDWEDSTYAATYTLQVDDDPTFAVPAGYEVDATLTESTYTVGAGVLSAGVTYYWCVTAVNVSDSTDASNNDFDFTTLPLPGAFALLDPPDGSTGALVTPTLDWEDSSDAATYTLQVDDDPLFTVPAGYEVDDDTLTESTYTVGSGVLTPGVTYYWRVTAVNASGTTAASTGDFDFTTLPLPGTFALLAPLDGATDEPLTPTLDWEDSTDIATYTLLVDENPAFGSPEVNETALTSSTYTVANGVLSLGTTYYWRVRAVNASGIRSASTGDFDFTTLAVLPPPDPFALTSPSNAATGVSLTTTLDWGDSGGFLDTYTLLVDDDPGFTAPEIADDTLTESTYVVPGGVLAPGVTYYWRVTAFNISASTPALNNDFSFTTLPVPGAFSLLSPPDGEIEVSLTPTLDWEDSADAAEYTLVVADNASLVEPVIDGLTLTESTYTVGAGALSTGVTYYWRVTAVNGSGTTAASTGDFSFKTFIPANVALTAPAAGGVMDVGTQYDITWTWRDITAVRIELSRDGGTSWEDIAASTDATAGSYTWNVTSPGSEGCLLKISDVDGIASPDEVVCKIAEITVTSPTGGEWWLPESQQTIAWEAFGVATVRIEISRNGGTTWEEIAAAVPAAGPYTWTVSEPRSSQCLVRVSDAPDGAPEGVSPAEFRIAWPDEAFAEPYLGDGCLPLTGPRKEGSPSGPRTGAALACLAVVALALAKAGAVRSESSTRSGHAQGDGLRL